MAKTATQRRPGQQQSYVVALLGADLRTTLTPALHEREAALLGLRYVYQTVDMQELGLDAGRLEHMVAAARWLGLAGLNVTHPCKQAVVPLLDRVESDAAAIGAVNTVVINDGQTIGHNTDWSGFARSFQAGLPGAALGSVALLGAGGAGSAVGYALLHLGAGQVIITDVRDGAAQALGAALGARFGTDRVGVVPYSKIPALISGLDGVVNATPVGMSARPGMPLPGDVLGPRQWVADVVYRPIATALLREARRRGCRTLSGGGMAVYQAVHALELFTGLVPDEHRMLAHFQELLAHQDVEG